jgi:hypothetical protein
MTEDQVTRLIYLVDKAIEEGSAEHIMAVEKRYQQLYQVELFPDAGQEREARKYSLQTSIMVEQDTELKECLCKILSGKPASRNKVDRVDTKYPTVNNMGKVLLFMSHEKR